MNSIKLENQLLSYETDVRFPDVSGLEHLNMLLNRTEIENSKQLLSGEQLERLAAADQQLAQRITDFYMAIEQIADLAQWRENTDPPPAHWWWYLDVLVYAWPPMQTAIAQPATVIV
jgi:hypothetical protein